MTTTPPGIRVTVGIGKRPEQKLANAGFYYAGNEEKPEDREFILYAFNREGDIMVTAEIPKEAVFQVIRKWKLAPQEAAQ